MSKISTYPSADTPLLLSDRLIGTEAIRTPPTSTPLATKNFSLGELLQLFSSNFPAASLQAVLNTGNTATQNITLTGTITTTLIKPDNIEDSLGSQGTTFQYLSKNSTGINWVNLPVDNLQDVLNAGNTATQNITLIGNITSTKIIPGNIQDDTASIGTTGQILQKTASGIRWVNNSIVYTPGLNDVLLVGNTATNSITLIGDINASNARITGAIYDSNNSPGTAGQFLSSTVTGTDWVDGSASGYVPYVGANADVVLGLNNLFVGGRDEVLINETTISIVDDRLGPTRGVNIDPIGVVVTDYAGQNLYIASNGIQFNDISFQSTAFPPTGGTISEYIRGNGTLATFPTIPTIPLTTKGDLFTYSTTNARLPVGLDTQVLLADSTTATGLKWGTNTAATPTGYYAQYQDDITQTVAVINTGYPIKFRTLDISNGVTVVSDSRITFANTGIYNLQFSVQLQNSDTQEHDVTIWLRKSGVDVDGSSGFVAVVSKHGGVDGHVLPSWNYLLDVVAGEYYELVWSATSTQVTMPFIAAGNPPPSTASALFTVTQQAGIMAGTGITAINSLTGAAQTLTTGTTGTDFAIVDSGVDHKFNLPTASASNRGALSSSDWTTFNNKQDTLVSGTNIKSVNGFSLLGSGDLSVKGVHALVKPSAGGSVSVSVTSTALSAQAQTANRLIVSPFIPSQTITCASLYINVATLAAGSNAQILIYSNLNGKPDTKIYQSANLDCSTTGNKIATTTQTFEAGNIYWIGVHTSSTQSLTVISTANLLPIFTTSTTQVSSFFITTTFGSAPTTFGTPSNNSGTMPYVGITI